MSYFTGLFVLDWTTTSEYGLGTIADLVTPQGTKSYKYVRLRNETANVAVTGTALLGWPLAYLSAPAGDLEINTVVSDYTDAEVVPVCAGTAHGPCPGTINVAFFGWVQQRGYDVLVNAIGGTADNANIILSTTDGTATVATAATGPVMGYCIVDATKNIRLNCF